MLEERPQYQPTAKIQKLVDTIAPLLTKSLDIPIRHVRARSFQINPENKNEITIYVEMGHRIFKLDLEQNIKLKHSNVFINQIHEVIPE